MTTKYPTFRRIFDKEEFAVSPSHDILREHCISLIYVDGFQWKDVQYSLQSWMIKCGLIGDFVRKCNHRGYSVFGKRSFYWISRKTGRTLNHDPRDPDFVSDRYIYVFSCKAAVSRAVKACIVLEVMIS